MELILVIFWVLICPVVGGAIGQTRNCVAVGVLLGLLFGPLGWLLALLNDRREQCPECQGRVPDGAKRCQHCGAVFAIPAGYEIVRRATPAPPEAPKVKDWQKTIGADDDVAKWAKQNGTEQN